MSMFDDKKSRRRFIASVSSGLTVGVAGCSGGTSQSEGGNSSTAETDANTVTDSPTPSGTPTPQPPLAGGAPWRSRHGDLGDTRSTAIKFPNENLGAVGKFGDYNDYFWGEARVTQTRIIAPMRSKAVVYDHAGEQVFSAKTKGSPSLCFVKDGKLITRPKPSLIVGYSLDDGTREFAIRPELDFGLAYSGMQPTTEGILIFGECGFNDYGVEHWDLNGNLTWKIDKTSSPIDFATANPEKPTVYIARLPENQDKRSVIAYSLPEGNKKWELKRWASPIAVQGSKLVLANRKSADFGEVYDGLSIFDLNTQEIIWTGAKSIYSGDQRGDPIFNGKQPAIDDSKIYGCNSKTIAAFDYKSNEKIWSKPLVSEVIGSPIVTPNVLLYANQNKVRVVSKDDGSEITTISTENNIAGISAAGTKAYVTTDSGGFVVGSKGNTGDN